MTCPSKKVGDMVRSTSLIHTSKVSKDNIRVNGAAWKITLRSVKGGVEGRSGPVFVH